MLERGGRRGSIHTLYLYTTETPSSVKSKKEKRMGGCELFACMGALLIEEQEKKGVKEYSEREGVVVEVVDE